MAFYSRTPHYEEGQALVACSICGMEYLYPRELVYANDRNFYCTRTCWHPEWQSKTKLDDSLTRATGNRRRDNDQINVPGKKASWR